MHAHVILVGAGGDLGMRVLQELRRKEARVRCLVRSATSSSKREFLNSLGAEVREVDFRDENDMSRACEGGTVVVSTVSGLRDVIVDLQSSLLRAAVSAGVPRFIPSDFAVDYRMIPGGDNRNLNLREEFREILERTPGIQPTSILNGAFMDMLTGVAPFILFSWRRILCWGDPDQPMDWTTIDDTARFTACAALDANTPRFLNIAGDELSARNLCEIMTQVTGTRYRMLRPGGPGMLKFMIILTKAAAPGKGKIYPPWQGMQYMHSMYVGKCKLTVLDNGRYPIRFTTAKELLSKFLAGEIDAYVPHS